MGGIRFSNESYWMATPLLSHTRHRADQSDSGRLRELSDPPIASHPSGPAALEDMSIAAFLTSRQLIVGKLGGSRASGIEFGKWFTNVWTSTWGVLQPKVSPQACERNSTAWTGEVTTLPYHQLQWPWAWEIRVVPTCMPQGWYARISSTQKLFGFWRWSESDVNAQ